MPQVMNERGMNEGMPTLPLVFILHISLLFSLVHLFFFLFFYFILLVLSHYGTCLLPIHFPDQRASPISCLFAVLEINK